MLLMVSCNNDLINDRTDLDHAILTLVTVECLAECIHRAVIHAVAFLLLVVLWFDFHNTLLVVGCC